MKKLPNFFKMSLIISLSLSALSVVWSVANTYDLLTNEVLLEISS